MGSKGTFVQHKISDRKKFDVGSPHLISSSQARKACLNDHVFFFNLLIIDGLTQSLRPVYLGHSVSRECCMGTREKVARMIISLFPDLRVSEDKLMKFECIKVKAGTPENG